VALLFVGVLLVSLGVQAEEQNQAEAQNQYKTYSGWGRFVDNVKMFFSSGDGKVRLSLEIRDKEINSAISNVQNLGEDKAIKNLERAKKRLQYVQEKVSLDTSGEIKASVDEITEKINGEEDLPEEFDDYLLEEEKTQLTAVLTEKTFEYCTELAKEDFASMLGDEECNPETAIPGLEKDLKKLKGLQEESFILLMLEIRSCINDPGTCNCEASLDDDERAKCENMVALAVKCEYKDDEVSCEELEAMMPSPGDGFARSFIPDYLMGPFTERRDLIEYGLEHSEGVPEECWNQNDKPECEKYARIKEDGLDWDAQGNYIGWERGKIRATNGTMETLPTIQEAFPECYNEEGMFLSECGNINVVWNEDGSVNYIIDKQVDGVIDDFENKSAQHRYAPGTSANGTMNVNGSAQHVMETREGWMMVDNEWVVDEGAQRIKREMNQINNRIVNITYAPGTGPNTVVRGNATGDDGLEWEVEGDAAGGSSGGESGIFYEGGEKVVAGGGSDVVDNVVEIDGGSSGGGNGNGGNDIDNTVDPGPDGIVGVVDEAE